MNSVNYKITNENPLLEKPMNFCKFYRDESGANGFVLVEYKNKFTNLYTLKAFCCDCQEYLRFFELQESILDQTNQVLNEILTTTNFHFYHTTSLDMDYVDKVTNLSYRISDYYNNIQYNDFLNNILAWGFRTLSAFLEPFSPLPFNLNNFYYSKTDKRSDFNIF